MKTRNRLTGVVCEVELFVAALGAASCPYAEASERQRVADFLASHTRALEFLGGVPELVMPDPLESRVTHVCRSEPGVQHSYDEWSQHYDTTILPARSRAALGCMCESVSHSGGVIGAAEALEVKLFQIRKLVALLMLAFAATQPAAGSALLASALMLDLRFSPHAHSVSVVAEEGHLHLVLAHEDGAGRDRGHAPSTSGKAFAERDHVFHMNGDDAASASSRRAPLDPTPPLAIAVALPSANTPAWALRPSPERRARSSDLRRSVVLQL